MFPKRRRVGNDTLRRDAARAGSARPHELHMHRLRHAAIDRWLRDIRDPRRVQALARHARISTTLDVYARVGMLEAHEAVRAVPSLIDRTV